MGKVDGLMQRIADYGNKIASMQANEDHGLSPRATDDAIEARAIFKELHASLSACVAEWRLIGRESPNGRLPFLAAAKFTDLETGEVSWLIDTAVWVDANPEVDLIGPASWRHPFRPTHYQPLPPPPTETEGETK